MAHVERPTTASAAVEQGGVVPAAAKSDDAGLYSSCLTDLRLGVGTVHASKPNAMANTADDGRVAAQAGHTEAGTVPLSNESGRQQPTTATAAIQEIHALMEVRDEDVELLEVIGTGEFGKVWKGMVCSVCGQTSDYARMASDLTLTVGLKLTCAGSNYVPLGYFNPFPDDLHYK
jgi:hypothetical protein